MKGVKKSQENSQQVKITAFCSKKSVKGLENGGFNVRKRKSDDSQSSPEEDSLRLKPETLKVVTSPERKKIKKEVFGNEQDFLFEDFENDPFLSPKKEKSPKKNVLCESNSQSFSVFENCEIQFENPVKCNVLKSTINTKGKFEHVLFVENEKSGERGFCKLRDVWCCSTFSPGDVVTIQAVKTEEGWLVDNKNGFVVLFPDIVLSSTSLVASGFCLRQGIFNHFYKGIDASGYDKMLIGRLIHEFLQECLKIRSCSTSDFSKIIKSLVHSREYLRDFYFSNLKPSEIQKEIEGFVPHIQNFLDTYVADKSLPTGKNFKGTIEEIMDIEELIKSPTLGLQGRVDVTVKVKVQNSEKIAPLELKTGRASFSNEHKSQLMLYILLMKELGRKVDSGLLLYLKEDIMEEIIPQRDEIRNLFLLRNQFVRYFKNMRHYNFPDPIRNIKACNKCSFLRICSTYLKGEEEEMFESHPLKSIEVLDIKQSHVDYFLLWNKMLWLEYGEAHNTASENVEMSNLKLDLKIKKENELKHTFLRSSPFKDKGIFSGKFVHVLNGKSNRVCSGRIVDVEDTVVTLELDKRLEDVSDTYKIIVFQGKFLNFYLSNLGWFLEEKYENLRQIIIDKKTPTFQEKMDKKDFKEKCLKYLMVLNKEQQKAVLKCILCNDYFLIKGPPGTGKTQTIAVLVKILVAMGKRILIASHTHSSVDNILLRLDDVEFLRLGSLKSVNKEIHKKCYAVLIENCRSVDDIKKLFCRKVVASTCSGLDADFIQKEKFDVCIVDESSQVLQPEVLRPLFCCEKFILVGDEDQLPPIVQNLEAKKLGMGISMFEWLTNSSATVSLRYQYRMNSVINSLANSIAYNGLIECANDKVASATLIFSKPEVYNKSQEWVRNVLSCDLDNSVVFVETSGYFKSEEEKLPVESRSSVLEANIILVLISSLIKYGLDEESIGVIAPFCDQVDLLKSKLEKEKLYKVELNTVDQYQGRDKRVIFVSCTKENQGSREVLETELLNEKRRLTVAVTRAKHKLILVGDKDTVCKYQPFQKLISSLRDSQIFSLVDGEKDFYWKNYT